MNVIAVICGLIFVVCAIIARHTKDNEDRSYINIGASVFFVLFFILTAFSSYRGVPAGYRGVLLQFGAVKGVYNEGPNFIIPFMQNVELLEVRTQKVEAEAQAASKDLQIVKTNLAINFKLNPSETGTVYKNVGLDYANRIIHPAVQETLKAVTSQYTAEELIRKRSEVKALVDASLKDRLGRYGIIVEPNGVLITNFDFSDEFNKAIESKQVAQQDSEKQKYVLAKAQLEAETAITQAKGEAEANRIKAGALNTQGGQKVLAREWITKWNGQLPLVMGNQGMILDLRSLMEQK